MLEGHFAGEGWGWGVCVWGGVPLGLQEEEQTWLRGGSLCHLWQHQLSSFILPWAT